MPESNREIEIIKQLVLARGVTRFSIVNTLSEGKPLPGGAYESEVTSVSGYIVAPERIYYFWLRWQGGKEGSYTLDPWREIDLQSLEPREQRLFLHFQKAFLKNVGPLPSVTLPQRQPGQATEREASVLRLSLLSRGIESYELLAVQSGGQDLVGSLYPGEIQNSSGYIVAANAVYHFVLAWNWEQKRYTCEENGTWDALALEDWPEELRKHMVESQERLKTFPLASSSDPKAVFKETLEGEQEMLQQHEHGPERERTRRERLGEGERRRSQQEG